MKDYIANYINDYLTYKNDKDATEYLNSIYAKLEKAVEDKDDESIKGLNNYKNENNLENLINIEADVGRKQAVFNRIVEIAEEKEFAVVAGL